MQSHIIYYIDIEFTNNNGEKVYFISNRHRMDKYSLRQDMSLGSSSYLDTYKLYNRLVKDKRLIKEIVSKYFNLSYRKYKHDLDTLFMTYPVISFKRVRIIDYSNGYRNKLDTYILSCSRIRLK